MDRVFYTVDIDWLPKPNMVEIILSSEVAPVELTRTAFMIPVREDGAVVLAVNRRRGLEIAGGHVEEGETLEEAASREAYEETGAWVADAQPIGYLRMTVAAEQADDYPYPYPVSYQQFYAGRLIDLDTYAANDECLEPVVLHHLPADVRPSVKHFVHAARNNPEPALWGLKSNAAG